MATPRELLADLLKRARLDAGFDTQAKFAREINISRPQVTKAENPVGAVPSPGVLASWSRATGVPHDKVADLARRAKSGSPEWFMPYRSAERSAAMVRCWAPMIFPGLFQTEAYAREILSAEPRTPERLSELLEGRLERQEVLQRALVTACIDVGVLDRLIGNASVMAEQLARLAELAEQPNIAVHIVPQTNIGSWAAIDIASRDGLATVSFSTGTDDVTTTDTARVDRAIAAYERILGHAYDQRASLDYVRNREATWKDQI